MKDRIVLRGIRKVPWKLTELTVNVNFKVYRVYDRIPTPVNFMCFLASLNGVKEIIHQATDEIRFPTSSVPFSKMSWEY